MKTNYSMRSEIRNIDKKILIVLVLLPLLILVLLLGFSLQNQKIPTNNLTSFNCSAIYSNKSLTIYAEVNLTDGMDKKEASSVAIKLFDIVSNTYYLQYTLQSLSTSAEVEEGVWTMTFEFTYLSRAPSTQQRPGTNLGSGSGSGIHQHTINGQLKVVIDPYTHVVKYENTVFS